MEADFALSVSHRLCIKVARWLSNVDKTPVDTSIIKRGLRYCNWSMVARRHDNCNGMVNNS